MANIIEKLGEHTPDNLIANLNVKQITHTVTVKAGEGVLKRGTILAVSSTDAKCVILGTEGDGLSPYAILCDDIDATDDTVAEVYVAGVFNKNAVIVKDAYELTAADVLALRNGGIYLENSVR